MTLLRCPKSIFYHIPKTGGVWVETVLKKAVKGKIQDYLPPSGVKNKFNLYYGHKTPTGVPYKFRRNRFSFAMVRHPLAWYRSFWLFRVQYGRHGRSLFPPDEQWSDQPNKFIWRMLGAFPGGFLTGMYKEFLGEKGEDLDFVGRQENLVEDTIKALKLAGEDFDEDIIRKTRKKNVTKHKEKWDVTEKNEEKILKAEKWVIDKFY